MSDVASRIGGNLAQVRQRIAAAAERSGRTAAAVTLVAVTKYVPAEIAVELVRTGCTRLGESRPQELWSKAAHLADPAIRWHLIGHLQRNKIRRTLPLVSLIHSVDSWRLLAAVNEIGGELDFSVDVLLEANVAHDTTKTGLPPDELEPLLQKAAELGHVTIRGLMGMASEAGGLAAARLDFGRLRALRDRLAKNCPPNISLVDLSMGMSGDFEVAIEEGATIVRVGSALFEGIEL